MSELNFAAVFTIFSEYAVSLNNNKIYSELFYTYYEYVGKPELLEDYTASKVKSGKRSLEREGKQYYSDPANHGVLIDDIYERILPYISDKFGMCAKIRELIKSDSMDDKDRERLLMKYPEIEDDIAAFLADVIVFSLNRPAKGNSRSPIMSERVNLNSVTSCKYFCGRKKELQALSEMLKTLDKIFVYGVGGIGKSEFVKKFIKDNKSDYTNILFLTYSENLKNTIAGICFKEDKADDKIDDLFTRHMNYLRFMQNDTLIVIDNFDIIPDDDENIDDVMSLNCKLIFTTRSHVGDDYDIFELSEMDTDEIMLIAMTMKISESADTLYRLFTAVHNHTLACELILKLIAKSAYRGEEILFRLMDSNINPDITDKIRRNGKGTATYTEHIQKLFDLFTLSDEQQDTLRLLSLVPTCGIGDTYFKELAGMTDFNAVNELDEAGLIYHDNGTIAVHPLIADVSASELIPDMSNCRVFLGNIICEARNVIDNPTNCIRQRLLLPIADNVIAYSDKSGNEEYYIYFINSLCTYAEVFYDTAHMKKFISEVDNYIER